jgi:hypothetical protein
MEMTVLAVLLLEVVVAWEAQARRPLDYQDPAWAVTA